MASQDSKQPEEEPKIVVDEDWKAQAQAEKQRLADQESEGTAAPAAGAQAAAPADAAGPAQREIPPASFATLVTGLVTQILFALGAIQDPQAKRRFQDLALAKHHIDTLVILEDKTKGNLTPEEKSVLDNALYEVRMAYVRVAQGGG